jgi:hypothetical protein
LATVHVILAALYYDCGKRRGGGRPLGRADIAVAGIETLCQQSSQRDMYASQCLAVVVEVMYVDIAISMRASDVVRYYTIEVIFSAG